MIERCNHIEFFAQTYAFFKARHLPQAIVTVNPDIFSDIIVPVCEFASSCDAIVTSWEERTTDKRVLGELAIDRLGLSCENGEALLIDNKPRMALARAAKGGATVIVVSRMMFQQKLAKTDPFIRGLLNILSENIRSVTKGDEQKVDTGPADPEWEEVDPQEDPE